MGVKKTVLWLLVILAAGLTVAAVAMVLTGNSPGNPVPKLSAGRFTYTINDENVFLADGIGEIRIKTVSPDINVIPVEEGQIKAHLHGETVSGVSGQPVRLEAELRGNALVIEAKHKPNISINRSSVTLDVYVPSDFGGDMQLETISGRIDISGFNLNMLTAKSISGAIEVSSMATTSISVGSTSGRVRLADFSGNLDFNLVSGSLDAGFNASGSDIRGKTVSGGVSLNLPSDASFELEADTVSGRIDCDFPITVTGSQPRRGLRGTVGSGGSSVDIKTVSGGINIHRQ
jgi:lia operon protein LiaG